ncbi:MAG: DUF6732 family protein [Pseudomonadota bacterium]
MPIAFAFLLLTTPAQAHWGHVGEVAGHGHLIGIGLLAGAAALAAILAAARRKEKEEDTPEEEASEEQPA